MRVVSGPSEAVMDTGGGIHMWYPVTVAGRRSEQELWRKSCRENWRPNEGEYCQSLSIGIRWMTTGRETQGEQRISL